MSKEKPKTIDTPGAGRMRRPEPPSGPPLPTEVKVALEAAGYPFELRVFKRLKERGMSPTFGLRMRIDDTEETREIDIRAHRLAKGTSGLLALIQAKRLHEGAFVGFLGEQPSAGWVRFRRSQCSGWPSYWPSPDQLNDHGIVMVSDDGLGPAFDRFGRSPFCAQWCVVQRPKDRGRPLVAEHHAPTWADLETLIRAKMRGGHDASIRCMGDETGHNFVAIHFWFSALVLDAPMYTYDVESRALVQIDRLTVSISADTFDGVREDHIDVVTLRGLDGLIDDYLATAKDVESRMTDHVETVLLAIARRQREAWVLSGRRST